MTNLASSDAMKTMPSATSSERPRRPSGTCAASAALFSAVPVKRVSMPVSVGPGPTDTGMLTRFTGTAENKAALAAQVPLGRLGLSEEVADGIVFIASDEARFVTGHVLNVDGGMSAN